MGTRLASFLCAAFLLTPGVATAAPLPLDAIVALGDSIASGEGAGDYADNVNPNCHRSRNSELATARIPNTHYLNLACSGAQTTNITDTGQGGEQTQIAQLKQTAGAYRIRMILVTVGANNLGFSSIASRCAVRYTISGLPCHSIEDKNIPDKLTRLRPELTKTLERIRATMDETGQSDYRLVVQSYPSPIATSNRHESRLARLFNGCPFHDEDSAWARHSFVPRLNDTMRLAARETAAEFLDLTGSMDGKEICSPGVDPKWTNGIRFSLDSDGNPKFIPEATGSDGLVSRGALHPNQLGHAALGGCLTQFYAQRGNGSCQRDGEQLRFTPVPFE